MGRQFPFTKAETSNSRVLCWLVEVGDHFLDDVVIVSRCNDDLCTGVQRIELVTVHRSRVSVAELLWYLTPDEFRRVAIAVRAVPAGWQSGCL